MRPAGIDGWVEPVAGAAETVPTAELVDSAVKGIGTALGHDVDDGAGVAAVFGIEGVGDDAEFLSGIGIGIQNAVGNAGDRGIVIINTVKQEIIVPLARAVDGEAAQCIGLRGAGRQQDQAIGIASNQGQVLHLLLVDQVADLRGLQVDGRYTISPYSHLFASCACLQFDVDREPLSNG